MAVLVAFAKARSRDETPRGRENLPGAARTRRDPGAVEARDRLPHENYRHDDARYYAASQARRLGDPDTAVRELADWKRDLECAGNADRETILRRSRALLVALGR